MLKKGDPDIPFCQHSWNDHVSSFIDNKVLIIRYEDLLLDGLTASKRILDHVGREKSEKVILDDLERQSFNKRKMEFVDNGEETKAKHLRRGQVGDWKHHLTDKLNNEVKQSFHTNMRKFSYLD